MSDVVENKKVVAADSIILEEINGVSEKTGKPYSFKACTIVLKDGAQIKAQINQDAANLLFK